MGAVAPIIGGVLGLAGLSAYAMSKAMKGQGDSNAAALQALSQQNQQNAIDTLPETPTNIDTGQNEEAEAARQQQLQLMAANDAAVNPTGGLGVTSQANTKKKTLGGGI